MATKFEPEIPSSPPNDDSDGEEQESSIEAPIDDSQEGLADDEPDETELKNPANNNDVVQILKRLQSAGSLLKKPKQEYYCFTCKIEYSDWAELETHLITHVSLPSLILDKLPSDDEDAPQSGEEDWSDEEDETPPPTKTPPKTPQKIEISQLLKKTGLTLKKAVETSNSALDKLSGLGFTIKKSNTPIKKEPEQDNKTSDVMQKLGKLGGLKLKLKSEGNNSSSFKVVNGLRDFKMESDEEDDDDNDKGAQNEDFESDDEQDKSAQQEDSDADNDSEGEKSNVTINKIDNAKITNVLKNLQGKTVVKVEAKSPVKPATVLRTPSKEVIPAKPIGRPNMKQTPKRGANLPLPKEGPKIQEILTPSSVSSNSTPERRQSHDTNVENVEAKKHDTNEENVVVKKELETVESQSASNAPLFSGQIKTERSSPPVDSTITPVIATVKTETEPLSTQNAQPLFSHQTNRSEPLLPVTKTEDIGVTIIEINGDSNDEDDDCCVVSATPPSDIKPVIPKTEPVSRIEQVNYPSPSYPATSTPSFSVNPQSSYPITSTYGNSLPRGSSLEKNHSFNWNAPDSKPPIDMLEKSAEDIFESLLSNAPKKEGFSMSDNEYVSLDTLGPQQTCDVCNTRFTTKSLLEDHIRITGHSKSLVTPSSSTLLPYNPGGTSSILQSLLPVKQMVEQVGKMTGMGGPGFTHQQNVMINIQAYPNAGGVMPQQGAYNSYGQHNMPPPGFSQPPNNMYGAQQQQMPGQYPNQQSYGAAMGQQGYGQFQNTMPKSGYPPNSFDSSPYSAASPLQSMQQSVYGQPSMNTQVGQMGPPPVPPLSSLYVPTSSSAGMTKPPMTASSGVRIQNIQTFPPGQMLGMQGHPGSDAGSQPMAPGQVVGGQMPSPNQIRMASGVSGPRPRMPNVRGQRPSIRPGVQVHGQVRGSKPGVRMPMKRPGLPCGPGGPAMKKRPSMLLPGKHDNEDCQVMALQKQREGMPMIQSVQGAKDKLHLGSQISITKKVVNKEASAMANILATRGISVKQKQKSRSPSPERPIPHIPNLGAGVSIKHTSRTSNFSIPEAKVGGGMLSCKVCNKMFMNQSSLSAHMSTAHPSSKLPMFRCEECPAAYPKILQLQHHKRVFHNVVGPNRELGLPVVDMSQEDNLKRLSSLGIYSFIPLAGKDGGGGCFGLPIISVHNAQNGMTKNLQALGADGLLSLGPLKQLPNT